jgi:hypothetical protein
LIYEELAPISREDAAEVLGAGESSEVGVVLIRLALHDADWSYVQGVCLSQAKHPDIWVRRNVATALGHLARLHGQLDTIRVVPVLDELAGDPEIASWAEAAMHDLRIFLRVAPASD